MKSGWFRIKCDSECSNMLNLCSPQDEALVVIDALPNWPKPPIPPRRITGFWRKGWGKNLLIFFYLNTAKRRVTLNTATDNNNNQCIRMGFSNWFNIEISPGCLEVWGRGGQGYWTLPVSFVASTTPACFFSSLTSILCGKDLTQHCKSFVSNL